ncbi:MAG: hypothetical protein Q9188_005552 [Gyalolechia gomerana]
MAAPLQSHDDIYPTQDGSNTSIESKDQILLSAIARSSPLGPDHRSESMTAGEAKPDVSIHPTVQDLKYMNAPGSDIPPPPIPPPKAGEVVRPPEYHALERASVTQAAPSQTCWPRVSSASLCSQTKGSNDASWSPGGNALQQRQSRKRAQSLSEGIRAENLEHPPGYSQNPYAMEMAAEQRLVTARENQSEQGLPMPNSTHIRRSSISTLWRRARRDTESLVDIVHDWLSDGF